MNLLQETIDVIDNLGKTPEDIIYIGDGNGCFMDWQTFLVAANQEYDDGYGSAEVAMDLVIVFSDSTWLSRVEYDGSEWWEYNKVPDVAHVTPITQLFRPSLGEYTLKEINEC